MEQEEADGEEARDTRRAVHIGGAHGQLLRKLGSLLSRSDTRQVEHLIACAGRDAGLHGLMAELGIPVPPGGGGR